MTMLVSVKVETIEEVYNCLQQYGVLVDYDKKSDMKSNDKIVMGKVVETFPIYRVNENLYSDDDCFVLQLQKAVPVECLSQEPRIFRVLCQGDIISKLSHVQANFFIAFINPKVFSTCKSTEPTFVLRSNAPVVWEFPNVNLKLSTNVLPSLPEVCQKLVPVNKESALRSLSSDNSESESSSLDIGDHISHRSITSDVNKIDACKTMKLDIRRSENNSSFKKLDRSPVEHYSCSKNTCNSRKLGYCEQSSSYDSHTRTGQDKNKRNIVINVTNRDNPSSSSDPHECYELCHNSLQKIGQCCNTSPCSRNICYNLQENNAHGKRFISYVVDVDTTCCRDCDAQRIISAINNHLSANKSGKGACQIISPNVLRIQPIDAMPMNNCNHVVHGHRPVENNRCCSANHPLCENHTSTSMHSNKYRSLQSQLESDDELEEENLSASRFDTKKTDISKVICKKGKYKLSRNNNVSPEKNYLKRKCGKKNDRSPERDHLKYKSRRNNSMSPERDCFKRKCGKNNGRSPEQDHLKYKSRMSPERDCFKDKLDRNNSRSPERNHQKYKSCGDDSESPEQDHLKHKKRKKLYYTDPNASVLIGISSPADSGSSKTEKDQCEFRKQGQDSHHAEKLQLLPFNKSEFDSGNTNTNEMNKFQISPVTEKSSEGANTSTPCKQYRIRLNYFKPKKDSSSEDKNLSEYTKKSENNAVSDQEAADNNSVDKDDGDETIIPADVEANLPNEISFTDGNSQDIEKHDENVLEINKVNSLEEKNKSDLNKESGNGGSVDSLNTVTLDVNEISTADEETPPEMTQPYYDAQENVNDNISSQVSEFRDIIKTLSEQSLNSFRELFSSESDDFRESMILKLRQLKRKAQISTVVIDMCPDIRLDPLSIVKGICLLGCRQSFYINTIPRKIVKKSKCKCCRLITHYVCPSCSETNGERNLLCLRFCFDLHVLYGPNVLVIAVDGTSAERCFGCTLSNYLAYSSVSSHVVSILKKVIIDTPPEDWRNVILLKLNVKSTKTSNGRIILKLVNTYLGDSLIRRGCFISKEQL